MKLRKFMTLLISILLVCAVFTGCSSSDDSTTGYADGSTSVATDGSTSMEKVIGSLGEAFTNANEGVTFTYNPTGSGSGITAVSEGSCDIGLSSRALKDSEVEQGLTGTVLAYDGIAVIVNTANTVTELTLDQIAAIFSGEITNWSELGGDDAEIVVVGRESGSGTRDGFESVVGVEDICVYRQELTSTGDVISSVASNEYAIGYASAASVGDTVTTVAVDGVLPSDETILDGTYAIQRPFVLVTNDSVELSDCAQAFYDFCFSEEAREIITDAGVVPAF